MKKIVCVMLAVVTVGYVIGCAPNLNISFESLISSQKGVQVLWIDPNPSQAKKLIVAIPLGNNDPHANWQVYGRWGYFQGKGEKKAFQTSSTDQGSIKKIVEIKGKYYAMAVIVRPTRPSEVKTDFAPKIWLNTSDDYVPFTYDDTDPFYRMGIHAPGYVLKGVWKDHKLVDFVSAPEDWPKQE